MTSLLGTPIKTKITVLLDTNVIFMYIMGKTELTNLFSDKLLESVQYAINPVILQELLIAGSPFPEQFDIEAFSKKFIMLPIREVDSPEFLDRMKGFRNKVAHANSFLILGSGRNCDLILSYDVNMLELGQAAGVKVLNPEEFLAQTERGL